MQKNDDCVGPAGNVSSLQPVALPSEEVAEGVGFEPTELSFNGFQDRRLKPLGHPSLQSKSYICLVGNVCQDIRCSK